MIEPFTFETKLLNVMDEAIIALENVSGSPITNEGHDLMVALYKANGELMVGGVGFLHHLTSAAQAVKHVIANFSEDPASMRTTSISSMTRTRRRSTHQTSISSPRSITTAGSPASWPTSSTSPISVRLTLAGSHPTRATTTKRAFRRKDSRS